MPLSPPIKMVLSDEVSRETMEKLNLYKQTLLKWQKRINLISGESLLDLDKRHFLDSLQLLKLIPDDEGNTIDLGSGAGFPGLVLAIAGIKNVHLIESDQRKAAFLKEVARLTNTSVTIHNTRIEELRFPPVRTVISRACAKLPLLLDWTEPFLDYQTICIFHKGKDYAMELAEAASSWHFQSSVHASKVDAQGVILQLTQVVRHEL